MYMFCEVKLVITETVTMSFRWVLTPFSGLKMEAVCFSETSPHGD
jgi:hypothetical protein